MGLAALPLLLKEPSSRDFASLRSPANLHDVYLERNLSGKPAESEKKVSARLIFPFLASSSSSSRPQPPPSLPILTPLPSPSIHV